MAIARHVKSTSLALLALSSILGIQSAMAAGTDVGVSIANRATVNYSVGNIAQTPIESSPLGNSVPGVGQGENTTFVVDRRVFISVADVADTATTVPGATGVVRTFTVTNTSNAPLGFNLIGTNVAAVDDFDVSALSVFVDSAGAQPIGTYIAGTYSALDDTGTSIASLGEDQSVTVFIVATMPNNVVDSDTATVNLQAIATEPTASTYGAPGTDIVETVGADTAGVDTVFGDSDNDGMENDTSVYTISSATLTVTKAVDVISDDFNGVSPNAKAIPGAVLEYAIQVANNGGAIAEDVGLSDPVPANTTLSTGAYGGAGADVQIEVSGGATTTCTIATDGDGCSVVAGALTIAGANRPDIPAGQSATIRFRVTIQ